ncbi:MAG: LysR family transcriptional regulator for metE and metH, partial [Psychromonas sp.]
KLWQRCGRHLPLTLAGELLLKVGKQTVPTLEQAEMTLKAMGQELQFHPLFEYEQVLIVPAKKP